MSKNKNEKKRKLNREDTRFSSIFSDKILGTRMIIYLNVYIRDSLATMPKIVKPENHYFQNLR